MSKVPATDPLAFAKECLQFVDSSPTPFHLVSTSIGELQAAGFTELLETDVWTGTKQIVAGGKYFYTRNCSSIVAFTVGSKVGAAPDEAPGFKVVGAHTDSPVLKLKPVSKRTSNGYIQVGVEFYGGGLWHTWFDRELTIAGCVIVKSGDGFARRLIHLKKPLLRVPNLCIHLQTGEERAAFKVNKENHLTPILAMVESTLNAPAGDAAAASSDVGSKRKEPEDTRHGPLLLQILADELQVDVDDILDMELTLCDTQPPQIWGAKDEFLSGPRLDNQVHCFGCVRSLIAHSQSLEDDVDVSMVCCFDHEEVGSSSAQGAGSPIMKEAIERVTSALEAEDWKVSADELVKVAIRNSFLISADCAHAIHPNYAAKHEQNHQPPMNKGTVIKTNDNQRYATNAVSGFFIRQLARLAKIPVQEFVVRNDCPCGSTIGPMISANTGLRVVDVGAPTLSMHSIRETVGVHDIMNQYELFVSFFKNFRALDKACVFEGSKCLPISAKPSTSPGLFTRK